MLNMIKGAYVPKADSLYEEYEIDGEVSGLTRIHANIGADKLLPLFTEFIREHQNELLFFILEIPCDQEEERQIEIESGETGKKHKNVYYIDGLNKEQAYTILEKKGEMLIHDGFATFGFGGHESQDELMKSYYNICTAFTKDVPSICKLLEGQGIRQTDHLVTAWDTFSEEFSGLCMTYSVRGKCVFNLISEFEDWGIYLAERRED